jgi:hypothetical protein
MIMSKITIHGESYPISKIFSDEFVFTIPLYQRPYAWTTEHAGELLDDLITSERIILEMEMTSVLTS